MPEPLAPLYDSAAGPVWRLFDRICQVPRPSQEEARIRAFLREEAAANRWRAVTDDAGNLVVHVPGRGSLADANPIVLQGHMDMVAEKVPGLDHDFRRDPIRPRLDGDWVTATGTTLGADNGIALALAFALAAELEPADRLPLELLFTVDEETGLHGATNLDPSLLRGRRVLNLDNEDDDTFTIGCAGGQDMHLALPAEPADQVDAAGLLLLRIGGLRGGHSGVQIHEGRANALKAMAELLARLRDNVPGLHLSRLAGGNKINAIPRDSLAVIGDCPPDIAEKLAASCQEALRAAEPDATVLVEVPEETGILANVPLAAIDLLAALPNGVLAWDPAFPELVQTSNNVSVAETDAGWFRIHLHGRSSDPEEQEYLRERLTGIAVDHGAVIDAMPPYPGWRPNPDSRLLRLGRDLYRDLFGEEAKVMAVHAGLEAGIIGGKLGTDELLSYGPDIRNPHSPDERLRIASVNKVTAFLRRFLAELV